MVLPTKGDIVVLGGKEEASRSGIHRGLHVHAGNTYSLDTWEQVGGAALRGAAE